MRAECFTARRTSLRFRPWVHHSHWYRRHRSSSCDSFSRLRNSRCRDSVGNFDLALKGPHRAATDRDVLDGIPAEVQTDLDGAGTADLDALLDGDVDVAVMVRRNPAVFGKVTRQGAGSSATGRLLVSADGRAEIAHAHAGRPPSGKSENADGVHFEAVGELSQRLVVRLQP